MLHVIYNDARALMDSRILLRRAPQTEGHEMEKPSATDQVRIFDVTFTYRDIERVVDAFYKKVETDPLLQVPFSSVESWPEHIEKLTHFWWLRSGGKPYMNYRYNPPLKHFERGFSRTFLARWLELFQQTMKEYLNEDQVLVWASMSERMGESLAVRNEILVQVYGDPSNRKSN